MTSMFVKNGGVWKTVLTPFVKSGGTWRTPTKVWRKISGVWTIVWQAAGFTVSSGGSFTNDFSSAPSTITFGSDGSITGNDGTLSSNWGTPITPGVGAGYWIKFTLGSGAASWNGATLGTWLQLNSSRVASATGSGTKFKDFSYSIATDSSGTNVVANGSGRLIIFDV